MPADLSFRRHRPPKPTPPRGDATRGLSFRRRKQAPPVAPRPRDAARSLSFRRRRSKPAAPPRSAVRSLRFSRPRPRRRQPAGGVEADSARRLTLRRRRPRPAKPAPARTEPDALGLALRLAAVGLGAGLLQLLVVSQIVVLGVSADVTPLVVAAAGFLCGSLAGAGFGFGLGLFVDLAFVQTLGISSLLFTLVGYGAGRLRELRAPAAPLTRLLLGAAATVIALAGYGAIEFMLGVNTPVSAGLVGAIIKTTALNSLIAVPVYSLTRRALLASLPTPERRAHSVAAPSGGLSPLSRT